MDTVAHLQLDMEEIRAGSLCHRTPGGRTLPETQVGLVGAPTAHYGSPGRLADYRGQFERMTRTAGEETSIFAIALEILAVKASTTPQASDFVFGAVATALAGGGSGSEACPAGEDIESLLQRLLPSCDGYGDQWTL